ncbi:MAG TPA: DUF4340 domain-containing protein [Sedimentisphaerales bacterium]|nr:DUF4340 domain-containing protein [Sedimentisphaerales bacterium]
MSNRKLAILGIVAALMVVILTVTEARKHMGPVGASGTALPLIQGLDPARIASIVIGRGEGVTRLVRQGRRFVVENKDGYPASTSKVNRLIASCLDIRTMELITGNPANHESLNVSEEKAQNIVKFLGGDGQVITGVIVGSSRLPELQMEKRSTYVRLIGSNDVYEAQDVPLPESSPMDYVEKEIVDVDRSDVVRVTVIGPEGNYTLRADDSNDDNIVLDDIPEGKKLKTSDCREVLSALSSLSFNDVKKESSDEEGKLKFDNTYVSALKDSTVYTFKIAEADGKTYVKCSAQYTGEPPRILESGEELKDKEAKLLARDRAADFTKRHQGWVYEVSEWKAKNLVRKLADLLEEEKPKAQELKDANQPSTGGAGGPAESTQPE